MICVFNLLLYFHGKTAKVMIKRSVIFISLFLGETQEGILPVLSVHFLSLTLIAALLESA